MNIGHVLFSPNGRIGQQNYWIGVLIIIGANILLSWIPLLGFLISLVLIYVGICVYGKRLHDIGKTAWIHGIILIVWTLIGIVAFFAFAGAAITAAMQQEGNVDPTAILGASGAMLGLGLIGFLFWVAYTIWLGVAKGDSGTNRFGPPEGAAAPAAPTSNPTVTPTQSPPPSDNNPPPPSA